MVTGASRGIGRDLALHLASIGTPLGICARSEADLDATASDARSLGVDVVVRSLDITDQAAVGGFVDEVCSAVGPPWGLVNNAAVLGPVGPFRDADLDDWIRALQVDVCGVAVASRLFIPRMLDGGGGRIINLSGGGIGGAGLQPNVSAYTASKAAVAVLTETLARELAGRITVNAVAPGAQPTSFVDEVLRVGPGIAGAELYDATVRDQAAPASLHQLFELVEFLLAEDSGWLSGKLLSARWDRVDELHAARARLEGTSLHTLRRIDDALFEAVVPGDAT